MGRRNAGHQRRAHIAAAAGDFGLGRIEIAAFHLAGFEKVQHTLDLHGRNQRADIDRFVQRITDSQRLHARLDLGDESVFNRFLDQQPRAGAADLPLIEPDGVDQPLDGAVEIGVLKNDEG